MKRGIIRKKQGETRVRMQSVSTMFLTELFKLHMCFMDEDHHSVFSFLFYGVSSQFSSCVTAVAKPPAAVAFYHIIFFKIQNL